MTYSVKEVFYTLQGEGAQAGRPAVFCRFTGCNLWSGRERHRANAVCNFCDTDFVGTDGQGGGQFKSASALADHIADRWPVASDQQVTNEATTRPFVVCTGGEPLLQLDTPLIEALHERGFEIAIETNGTLAAPPGIDWICVSPKGNAPLRQDHGHELKLVYPQPEAQVQPEAVAQLKFDHYHLQPLDGPALAANTRLCVDYCLAHPQWHLSIQTHKVRGHRLSRAILALLLIAQMIQQHLDLRCFLTTQLRER